MTAGIVITVFDTHRADKVLDAVRTVRNARLDALRKGHKFFLWGCVVSPDDRSKIETVSRSAADVQALPEGLRDVLATYSRAGFRSKPRIVVMDCKDHDRIMELLERTLLGAARVPE